MSIVARARLWIRAMLLRRRVERDLEREMRFHLDMEIEQYVRGGMSLAEARRTALVAFGGVERHKEGVRDERGTRFIEELISDARIAVRAFRARPGFTATAAITMAIGIGAATTVYSIANWVLLRPVPGVSAPGDVVRIDIHRESSDPARPGVYPSGISYSNLRDIERETPALRGLAGTAAASVQFSAAAVSARGLRADVIAGDYFGTLGVRPQIGRFFDAGERSLQQLVNAVVISDRVWHSAFAGDAGAVGRTVRMNGNRFIVIGVAPRGFVGVDQIGDVDLWLPAGAFQDIRHFKLDPASERSRGIYMDVIGRLSPGATPALAQMQIRAALARLVGAYPDANGIFKTSRAYVSGDLGVVGFHRPWVVETLRLLSVVATVVLLISCANAANLLLLRGIRRRAELAVRRALGASIGRVVRQQLTEGAMLSLLGCVLGVVVVFALRFVLGDQTVGRIPPLSEMPIDWRVLAFALALSLAAGLTFALLPALLSAHSDLLSGLRDSSNATAGPTVHIRDGMSVVQIAAAMSLVVCGILFTRTLHSLHQIDVGFDADHTYAFIVDPSPQGYDAARIREFRERLASTLASSAELDGVSLASSAPFIGGVSRADLRTAEYGGADWPVEATSYAVQPSYFSTLRIPILAGSTVPSDDVAADSTAADQVVVSHALAERLFGQSNPIGRSIVERIYKGTRAHTIVGVVGDVRAGSLRGDAPPVMFTRLASMRTPGSLVLVHSSTAPAIVENLVRRAATRVDPAVPVERSWLMSDAVARSMSAERLFARLLTTLAAIGALLAAAGLYGIIAYAVAERTREIGIRMALGAPVRAVVRLVTRRLAAIVGAGLAMGVVASVWLSRLLASTLFGVTPLDPSSYALGALVLIVLGAIAAAMPARTATRVNAVEALRHE